MPKRTSSSPSELGGVKGKGERGKILNPLPFLPAAYPQRGPHLPLSPDLTSAFLSWQITSKQNDKPVTIAQKLGSAIKSARDIMRTDKGLNGELDRLPQLTWIMFLKLLDDSEKLHEVEAELEGIYYKPTIQPPYRWRDWAANENFTGDRKRYRCSSVI